MACNKQFTLTIDPNDAPPPGPCVNFDELAWTEEGSFGTTSWSATGPDYTSNCTLNANSAGVGIIGQMNYDGPSSDCVLNLAISRTGAAINSATSSIFIQVGGVTVVNQDLSAYADGNYAFPFVVGSGGVLIFIRIRNFAQSAGVATQDFAGSIQCLSTCFLNVETTAHADCAMGSFGGGGIGTVPEGEIRDNTSQEDVDNQAMTEAETRATADATENCCVPTPSVFTTGQTPGTFGLSASISISGTSPHWSGSFIMVSTTHAGNSPCIVFKRNFPTPLIGKCRWTVTMNWSCNLFENPAPDPDQGRFFGRVRVGGSSDTVTKLGKSSSFSGQLTISDVVTHGQTPTIEVYAEVIGVDGTVIPNLKASATGTFTIDVEAIQ